MKTRNPQTRISTIITPLLLLIYMLGLSSCLAPQNNQLSFVGPKIEGIRMFMIYDLADDSQDQVLPKIRNLGAILVWYPDGEKVIVFSEDHQAYFTADVESGNLGECLTCGFEDLYSPTFSQNGEMITWGAKDGIYLQYVDNLEILKIADVDRPDWLSWGKDERLVFAASSQPYFQIFLLDVISRELTQLTPFEENIVNLAPAWSPQGEQIAFHRVGGGGHRLMLIDANGSDLVLLTEWTFGGEIYEPGLQPSPIWSPDGEWLLFPASSPNTNLDIFKIHADGSGLVNLTRSAGRDWFPAWSPDGKQIAFVTNRDGSYEIHIMNTDGSEQRNVSNWDLIPIENPAWRP